MIASASQGDGLCCVDHRSGKDLGFNQRVLSGATDAFPRNPYSKPSELLYVSISSWKIGPIKPSNTYRAGMRHVNERRYRTVSV